MDSDTITLVSVAPQLGAPEPFYLTLALVLARIAILVILSCLLGFLGVVAMDFLTPVHGLRQRIGQSAVATALFAGGCLILIALVVHGAATTPGVLGGPVLSFLADPRRLSIIAASFLISMFLLIVIFRVLDRVTPDIPLVSIGNSSDAAGIYVFSYLVAFGLILHAAMKVPL